MTPSALRVHRQSIGIVKELGYPDLQHFLADRSKVGAPLNLMVGVEETGLHDIYTRARYSEKLELFHPKAFVFTVRPTSILCIGEGWDAAERAAEFPRKDCRSSSHGRAAFEEVRRSTVSADDFIIAAKNMGILVHFGAFGNAGLSAKRGKLKKAGCREKGDPVAGYR